MATCNRRDCGKELRSTNTTGHCWSSCRSPDAPAGQRAQDVRPAPAELGSPQVRAKAPKVEAPIVPVSIEQRFKMLFTGLGKNPDAMLTDFMEACIGELEAAFEAVQAGAAQPVDPAAELGAHPQGEADAA